VRQQLTLFALRTRRQQAADAVVHELRFVRLRHRPSSHKSAAALTARGTLPVKITFQAGRIGARPLRERNPVHSARQLDVAEQDLDLKL